MVHLIAKTFLQKEIDAHAFAAPHGSPEAQWGIESVGWFWRRGGRDYTPMQEIQEIVQGRPPSLVLVIPEVKR